MVKCRSMSGEKISVPLEKMHFRCSVYGLIPHKEQLRLVTTRATIQLELRCGAMHLGEPKKPA